MRLTAGLFLALLSPWASARTSAGTHRLAWTRGEGASECPDEGELAARVEARLRRQVFSDAGSLSIEGFATRSGASWHAELRVRDASGVVLGSRDLDTIGDDCSALSAATTLAIVLAIDPNANLVEGPGPSETPAALEPPPLAPAPEEPAPRSPRPVPPPAARPPACPACAALEPRFALSALAVGTAGLLPRVALGAELDGSWSFASGEVTVGLRVLPGADTEDGHIGLGLATGRVGACARWVLGSAEVAACGGGAAGAITAVAHDLTPVRPGHYPWVDVEGGPRLLWPNAAPIRLELGLAAVLPLIRHHFLIQTPASPSFQANALGWLLALGLRLGNP